jgi:hypothetical protein
VGAKLQKVEQLGGALLDLRRRQQVVAAEYGQVLDRGKLLQERVLLERHAQTRAHLARLARHVDPEHVHVAAGGPRHAVDHLQRRRLAGAIGPQQPEAQPRRHLQVHPVHREALPEAL